MRLVVGGEVSRGLVGQWCSRAAKHASYVKTGGAKVCTPVRENEKFETATGARSRSSHHAKSLRL